ncbi:MAG: RimK family alpha-L-glutamate ligase, partial [Desulfatiglandales bacterium]
ILLARNKFLTLQTLFRNAIPVPESRYASNWLHFEKAVSRLGGLPVVIKALSSRQGRGVFLIDSVEKYKPLLNDFLSTGHGVLIQEFIPPEKRKDIRLMVVDKKVAGAMALIPRKGDFRANIHRDARAEKIRLTKEMSRLAIKSTQALGLDISGVDMIEQDNSLRVIDVNYSPGFKGLEKCTGKDVAAEIIKYVIKSSRYPRCK